METRPLAEAERKYTYMQSMQIRGQTGSAGVLQGRYGGDGKLRPVFLDPGGKPAADGPCAGLADALRGLCSHGGGLLQDLGAMREYASRHPQDAFRGRDGKEYGFRADAGGYAFLARFDPSRDDYNMEIHCYVKGQLDRHIREAGEGIRFIDSRYNELFRIADGERIRITDAWGHSSERACRYIDGCHTEIGGVLFHICQFAELMERGASSYAPAGPGDGRAGGRLLEFERWSGASEQVEVDVGRYPGTGGLCVSLLVPLDDICQDPYCDVTASLTGPLPPYCAFVDTGTMPEMEGFLVKNRIAEFTGLEQKDGGKTYPLYRFNAGRLKELCPHGTEIYEHANGLDRGPEKKGKSR